MSKFWKIEVNCGRSISWSSVINCIVTKSSLFCQNVKNASHYKIHMHGKSRMISQFWSDLCLDRKFLLLESSSIFLISALSLVGRMVDTVSLAKSSLPNPGILFCIIFEWMESPNHTRMICRRDKLVQSFTSRFQKTCFDWIVTFIG